MGAALASMGPIWRCDRFGERVGILRPAGPVTHTEELCGDDVLTLNVEEAPGKYDRLLWMDPVDGVWREHVVTRVDESLRGGARVRAESSLCDLRCAFIEERRVSEKYAKEALPIILDGTGWGFSCDVGGRYTLSMYHVTGLAALRDLEETWSVECRAEIAVSGGRVASRTVAVSKALGRDRGLRLAYARDVTGLTRTIGAGEVYTALYGYGAGVPVTDDAGNPTGFYKRKLTFGSVNDGKNWVGDEAAREKWGLLAADGVTRLHRFGSADFPKVEVAMVLLGETRRELKRLCEPRVLYTVTAAALGEKARSAGLGDTVRVVDTSDGRDWRVSARVVRRERVFGDEMEVSLGIGNAKGM